MAVSEEEALVTLIIENLPFRARWQDLKDLFRRATPNIDRADVALGPDGRSKGFGMVRVRGYQGAAQAIELFDGYEWLGRQLVVRYDNGEGIAAAHVQSMQGASVRTPLDYGSAANDRRLVYIGNLPFSTQWQELKDFLRPAGNILRADIAMQPDGRSRGWGTALFGSEEDAKNAVDMFDKQTFEGRVVQIKWERVWDAPPQPYNPIASASSYINPNLPTQQYAPVASYAQQQYASSPYMLRNVYSYPQYQQWQQAMMPSVPSASNQPSQLGQFPSMMQSMSPPSSLPQQNFISQMAHLQMAPEEHEFYPSRAEMRTHTSRQDTAPSDESHQFPSRLPSSPPCGMSSAQRYPSTAPQSSSSSPVPDRTRPSSTHSES